ncbi:DUF5336 domain-containing protein [Mycolicibacterium komossense]|uniref:DUF5336 domain-containing protein n=1 Tax=Mycolicibacterium komossense TaxID=1779 RepID=A0ABT3CI05_9MYCO|nr:DUF5336 domain-containing protein [Mycolicibacterium komossense]MCV7229076.1 DUF5336 domain-containing protein [Mycolicibacterium komossense]
MSYPPSPDQYGGQPGAHWQGTPPGVRAPAGRGLPFYAHVGVVVLGVVSFFLGFAPYAKVNPEGQPSGGTSVTFFDNAAGGVGVAGLALLLASAAIAAFGLLPGQARNESVVAGLAVSGFASLLFLLIGLENLLEAGVGLILVLVAAFLQAASAVASILAQQPYPPAPPYGGAPSPYNGPGPTNFRPGDDRFRRG